MAGKLCSGCEKLRLDRSEHIGDCHDPPTCSPIESPPSDENVYRLIGTDYVLHDMYPDFPALREGARLGCRVCHLFLEAAQEDHRDQDPDEPKWPSTSGREPRPLSAVAAYRMTEPSSYELGVKGPMLSTLDVRFSINDPVEGVFSPVLRFTLSTEKGKRSGLAPLYLHV